MQKKQPEQAKVEKQQVNVLVCDSYHTARIATVIKKHLGDKVNCYQDNCPEGVKIDIFYLSGRDVINGGRKMIDDWKQRCGSKKSKVVAVSALDNFLERIKAGAASLNVDFIVHKGKFVDGLLGGDGGDGDIQKILHEIYSSVK